MTNEIMVYFNSGNRARLNKENVVVVEGCPDSKAILDSEATVVNWANVCFIRQIEERQEDSLHDAE